VPVTLPIEDAYIDGHAPMYEAGQPSLTQKLVEQTMERDFPTVALLGIEIYCERLLEVEYTDGTKVFYLDWAPTQPGYVLLFVEPWSSRVDDEGHLAVQMIHYTGIRAASEAERIRRLIPPGETHN
jgi:hypothetical protein